MNEIQLKRRLPSPFFPFLAPRRGLGLGSPAATSTLYQLQAARGASQHLIATIWLCLPSCGLMAGAPRPVKTVGEEFVAHRLIDPLNLPHGVAALPHPLNMQAYVRNAPSHQTQRCAEVAVEQYNQLLALNNITGITGAQGIHSNMFILSHSDPFNLFHAYFKAYWQKEKVYCFAELYGSSGPERLIVMAKLDSQIIGPGRTCRFCFGGVRHPSDDTEFRGRQPAEGELVMDLKIV